MGIDVKNYVRKPFEVKAVQVTEENFEEVVAWCGGEIETTEGNGARYIHVRVQNPKNQRQTKAFVGDWILHTNWSGYKVYLDRSFQNAFELDKAEQELSDPRLTGDATVDTGAEEASLTAADEPLPTVGGKPEPVVGAEVPVNGDEPAAPATDETGKRIISLEEQKTMPQDEIRRLIESGEGVLVQEVAQA